MTLNQRLIIGNLVVTLLFYVLAGLDKLSQSDPEAYIAIVIVVATVVWIGAKRENK